MIDLIEENNFLMQVYGPKFKMDNVSITSCTMSYTGPELYVSILSTEKPNFIPAKWDLEFDSVAIGFSFFGLLDLKILKWGNVNKCNVLFKEIEKNKIFVSIKGKDCDIELLTEWIYFKTLKPILS